MIHKLHAGHKCFPRDLTSDQNSLTNVRIPALRLVHLITCRQQTPEEACYQMFLSCWSSVGVSDRSHEALWLMIIGITAILQSSFDHLNLVADAHDDRLHYSQRFVSSHLACAPQCTANQQRNNGMMGEGIQSSFLLKSHESGWEWYSGTRTHY